MNQIIAFIINLLKLQFIISLANKWFIINVFVNYIYYICFTFFEKGYRVIKLLFSNYSRMFYSLITNDNGKNKSCYYKQNLKTLIKIVYTSVICR